MIGEEGVCVCEYMWHARSNCCTGFTEGGTKWGNIYVLEKGSEERRREGKCVYMHFMLHVLCSGDTCVEITLL